MTIQQWNAIKNKDRKYDGLFYYGLKTTKHICRPSCPSRLCNPKNVVIFECLEDGLEKGYTPCRRCHPEKKKWRGNKAELAAAAKKYMVRHYREKFVLKEIADQLFINENYLLRTFKEITGQTMLEFHNYVRCTMAKKLLTQNDLSISYISNYVGYATPSHFTRTFRKVYGYTPSQYRKDYLKKFQ